MVWRLIVAVLVLVSVSRVTGAARAAELPDEAIAQYVAEALPELRYIGSCDGADPRYDAGALCYAYLLGLVATDAVIYIFVGWTEDGWQVIGKQSPYIDGPELRWPE